ncbi:MAG: iron transporter, partial [Propionibacteriaceae bacterium]|nr:iron transporter [Propionibacteriaceae bacterium]
MKIIQKAAIAAGALALLLSGCSAAPAEQVPAPQGSETPTAAETEEQPSDPNVVGINELEVGDSGPQLAGDYLEVAAVYFQAVDMEHGTMAMPPASESDMHF